MEEKSPLREQMIERLKETTDIEQLRDDYIEVWQDWQGAVDDRNALSLKLADTEDKLAAAEARAKKAEDSREYYRDLYFKALDRGNILAKALKEVSALLTD